MCIGKNYNYAEKHQHLKRKMKDLDTMHEELMNVIKAYNGNGKKPINKEDLKKFPLLEWVSLNDLVSIRRRKNIFGDHLNFDTKMKKGGEFGKHFHEDLIESCEVISGKMLDELDGNVYLAHDVMHYEKGQHHKPMALEDSMLNVIFKP